MARAGFYPHLRRYLHQQAALLARTAVRVADTPAPRAVHELRVVLRQSRSVLTSLELTETRMLRNIRHLARKFGRVRDHDVLIAALRNQPGLKHYRAHLEKQRETYCVAALQTLQRKRSRKLPAALRRAADHLPRSDRGFNTVALDRLARQLSRTKLSGRAIGNASPMADLHRLRIECKKLRYLTDMFSYDNACNLMPLDQHLRPLLQLLGDLQDNAVRIESITRYAGSRDLHGYGRAELIDLGRYIGHAESESIRLRRAFPELWQQFDDHCKRKHLPIWLAG